MASLARVNIASVAAPKRAVVARVATPASVSAPAAKYAVIEIGGTQHIVEEGR